MSIYGKLINESYIINEKDILYNKEKFDSEEVNLCFITGHSGSGKTTLGRDLQNKDNVETYELDDLLVIADRFTMENLKEYGDLIYSYFNGYGKKFYITYKELVDNNMSWEEYEEKLYPDFIHYSMSYSKSHKDKKFVIEGIWMFCCSNNKPWFEPREFDKYAFYIKGTSAIVSKYRAAKRDSKKDDGKIEKKKFRNIFLKKNWKWYFFNESRLHEFRKYFKNKVNNKR